MQQDRHVVMLANPHSGRGRAAPIAGAISEALAAHGFAVRNHPLEAGDAAPLRAAVANAAAVLIVGGDGTVHRAAAALEGSGAPIYHVPTGTENLFARHFGMSTDPARVIGAIERGTPSRIDLGAVGPHRFAIMASVGPDASVVHRLAASRSGTISHLSYATPILREVLRPHLPRLTVVADGKPLIEGRRGMLLVANSPEYGGRLDPARDADLRDGLLDVVFLPAGTSLGLAGRLAACRCRIPGVIPGVRRVKAARVEVHSEEPPLLQLDGDAAETPEDLAFTVRPGALSVLVP